MSFANIIGQQKQLESLRAAFAKGRLHHAYLFSGPEGVGKRTVALALARAIHCSATRDDGCGVCVNCTRITAGNHPDVRLVEPLAGKKEISIQQVREVEKEIAFRSFTGGQKVVIFDPATLMNLSAQNALLKTLEEPPANSLLILIAANPGALLPTVRSRCLKIAFGPLERGAVASFLMSKEQIERDQAHFLAALSSGSLGRALRLRDSKLSEKRREWADWVISLRQGDYRSAGAAAEKLAGNKEDALNFLAWAETFFRDLVLYAVSQAEQEVVNLDMIASIRQLTEASPIDRWLQLLEQTAGAGACIQRNLNRRMVLEDLLFEVVGAR